jgi:hypothetical protein
VQPVEVNKNSFGQSQYPAHSQYAATIYQLFGVSTILGFTDFLYESGGSEPRGGWNICKHHNNQYCSEEAELEFDKWWANNWSYTKFPEILAIWPADEAFLRCSTRPEGMTFSQCLQPYYNFARHIRDKVWPNGVQLADTFDPYTVESGNLDKEIGNIIESGIRWLGYHQYGIKRPLDDATYKNHVHRVREMVDSYRQQGRHTEFFLVGDGFHLDGFDGAPHQGWTWNDHKNVLEQQLTIACRNHAIAFIIFNWPSWLENDRWFKGSSSFEYPADCGQRCIGYAIKYGELQCDFCSDSGPLQCCNSFCPRPPRRKLEPLSIEFEP